MITDAFVKLGELIGRAVSGIAEFFLTKCLIPLLDAIGKAMVKRMPELLAKLAATPEIPPEVKAMIDRTQAEGGESQFLAAMSIFGGAVGPTVGASIMPGVEQLKQVLSARQPFQLIPLINLMILKFRNLITDELFYDTMRRYGYADWATNLIHQSYHFYPAPQDLINWIAKEVFEPLTISEFGLTEEVPLAKADLFAKAGVTEEQLRNFWIAHWIHPAYRDIVELYRREKITQETFWKWFKLVEIPPIWRQGMIDTSWDTPNRIETRMMCRYLDMSKAEVMKLLQYAGLEEQFRSNAADFMIIMGIEGDIRTRYRNGWISDDEVKGELTRRGVSADIAERVYQRIVKEEKPERVAKERDLTKSEIYRGVKKGVISWGEGIDMLTTMGYDQSEAQFILEVNVGSAVGSPENKAEFMKWAELAQAASGAPTKRPLKQITAAEAKALEERGKTRAPTEEEIKIQTDTVRRKRRKNLITRDQEIAALLELGWDTQYATAAADNDDIRLAEKAGEE